MNDRDLANDSGNPGNLFVILGAYPDDIDTATQFHSTNTDGNTNSYTAEFRIDRNDDSDWQYTAGIYYENTSNYVRAIADLGANSAAVQTELDILLDSEKFGYFTHNRIRLSDISELQIGLRYNRIRRETFVDQFGGNGYTQGVIDLQDPAAPQFKFLPCLITPDASVGCGASTDGDFLASLVNKPNGVDDAFTGGVKYLHHVNDDIMLYTSLDASFRPGGQALEPRIILNADKLAFNEESTYAFELGMKSTLWDGRMQLNAAIYYQQFNEFQNYFKEILMKDQGLSPFITGVTANADAISQGVEIEMVTLLTDNWKASIGISYNDFTFADGEEGPCSNGTIPVSSDLYNTCELGGQRVSDNTNWSANLSSEYIIPTDNFDYFIRGLYNFNGWTQNPGVTGTAGRAGSYGIIDLFAGVRSQDNKWETSLWVKNLLNKHAETQKHAEEINITNQPVGYREVSLEDERSAGVTVHYNFSL